MECARHYKNLNLFGAFNHLKDFLHHVKTPQVVLIKSTAAKQRMANTDDVSYRVNLWGSVQIHVEYVEKLVYKCTHTFTMLRLSLQMQPKYCI